jgi:uncharacterized delta-60 repeat protein
MKGTWIAVLSTVGLLAFTAAGSAAPGDLDPTFGAGGKVTTDFGGFDIASDVAVQPDGRIVVVGETFSALNFWAIARYLPDGTLDAGFGTGGKTTTGFDATSGSSATTVLLQSDGKIVAAGFARGIGATTIGFSLARYETSGALDPTFGAGGTVFTPYGGIAADAAIQADGKIVAVGSSGPHFALVRYDADGSLDPTFGVGGEVITDFGGADSANAVALQGDGRLVAAGSMEAVVGSPADFAVARYQTTSPTLLFDGFFQPVGNPPAINAGRAERTYPVKFRLRDGSGLIVSDLAAVSSISVKTVICGSFDDDPTNALPATTTGGTSLRFDAGSNQFVYNWNTPSTPGCYELFVTLADGSVHHADFQLT